MPQFVLAYDSFALYFFQYCGFQRTAEKCTACGHIIAQTVSIRLLSQKILARNRLYLLNTNFSSSIALGFDNREFCHGACVASVAQ